MALDQLQALLDEVRAQFASDPRLAVFEVEAQIGPNGVALVGVCSEPAAAEALHRRAALLDLGVGVRDAVTRLPLGDDGGATHALIRSATAPMLAGPEISDPQISQVVLGHRVLVLRRHGRWAQCRSDDGYIGWIHQGYLAPATEIEARAWEIASEGEACVSLGAEVRDGRGELMIRLPWGARVIRSAEGTVRLPDGRSGNATGDLVPTAELPRRFPLLGSALCATANAWLGVPYLWSGLTQAGVDCSGFVQALFRMHGLLLPRDSDQQAAAGEPVEPGRDWSRLQTGDLLFFAEEGVRITHVTVSLGGCGIVHASLGNGGVARNSLRGELEYERELGRLFVTARRVIA